DYRTDTYSLSIADFNYDGKDDIAYRSGKYISWVENLGPASNEVRGYARMDFNENGCDFYDRAVPYLKVLSNKENDRLVTFTSTKGYYRLLPDEGNYTTSIISGLQDYFDVDPNPHTSNFIGIGNREDVNFCITRNQEISDLNIILIPTREARPGFEATYKLLVKNMGSTLQNANITLEFDSRLSLTRSSWRVASQNSTSATFEVNNLRPLQ